MKNITKRFVDVIASNHVSLTLYPNEIIALLGENGAGKTTLMNILFGYYQYDEGEIYVHGKKVAFKTPKDAIQNHLAMIHQHFTLVPTQTVLENVIIGMEGGFFLDLKKAADRLLGIEKNFGLFLPPEKIVADLSIGEKQKLEILKALYRDAEILIMDEPTAVLSPTETSELFTTLKNLVRNGKSIIFISHKLNEIMSISDRVYVLRNGTNVAERVTSNTTIPELATLMVGRELLEQLDRGTKTSGEPTFVIENLTVKNKLGLLAIESFNLSIKSGEILGIAGVSGNGQTELSEALFGLVPVESGTITIGDKKMVPGNPSDSIAVGMARIPEDRIATGLFMDLSIVDNMALRDHKHKPFCNFGLVNKKALRSFTAEKITQYQIKTDGMDAPAKSLSGGNLQKIILARELAGNPRAIVACQPTRGLDVGAMEYVHQMLLKEREAGAAVLLISDDLDEIYLISDRIAVMYEGRLMGILDADKADRETIGLWMSGVSK
jgi:simple sugar transport system ATP-binding protein